MYNFQTSGCISETIQDNAHSYCRTLVGNHTWSIEWCHCQWSWV